MSSERPVTDMQKLMAALGNAMLHWCFLEDELTEAIKRLRIESEGSASRIRGTFGDRLSEWRGLLSQKTRRNPPLAEAVADQANEIERLRTKRNLIAHNLAGADASPDESEPHVWCADRAAPGAGAERTQISLADLDEMIQAMDRCRYRVQAIGR